MNTVIAEELRMIAGLTQSPEFRKDRHMTGSLYFFHYVARLGFVALLAIMLEFLPAPATAQETPSDLAASAGHDVRLLQAFHTLERAAGQMDHYVAYAIIASSGGWRVTDGSRGNLIGNGYVIRSNADDLTLEVARAAATVTRSPSATETDVSNAESAASSMETLFDSARTIADLLEVEDMDGAAALYRDRVVEAHAGSIRAVQTSISDVQRRLGRTLIELRMLE